MGNAEYMGNQFGGQEPGTNAEIRSFAESKGVPVDDPDGDFYVMGKVDVNGPDTHPVYAFLKDATDDHSDIKWNFGSYWLVDGKGCAKRIEGGRNGPSSFRDKIQVMMS